MEHQNNNLIIKSVKQRKVVPVELQVDIFKTASYTSLNDLKICLKNEKMEKDDQIKKYWHKFAKNILTSSGIVYSFVGESFKKMKVDSGVGKLSDFLASFDDESARTRLSKLVIHLEKQLKSNKEIKECFIRVNNLLDQQSLDTAMKIGELKNFLGSTSRETSTTKAKLTGSKSLLGGCKSMVSCEFCGGKEYSEQGYKQHITTTKHKAAVAARKRKGDGNGEEIGPASKTPRME